jgi:hypothetical protein
MGIHWIRQRADATLAGIVVGTLFAVGLTLAGVPRLGGVHVGVIGLGLNAAIVVLVSWARSRDSAWPLRSMA